MKIKKVAIVLVLLGLVSFGASFGVSALLKPSHQQAGGPSTQPAERARADLAVASLLGGGGSESVRLKESQLDELAKQIGQKMADLSRREARLDEREKRLAMAEDVLRKEAQDLDNYRVQLVAPLTRVKEAQAELEKLQLKIAAEQKVNLKKTAAIYEKMESAAAANILKTMSDNRQEDDAVKILHFMSERSAAKVLGELTDKALAARLTEKLKRISEEG
jgi:flagellar motility protein MotE (MotC chaperone)